MPSACHMMDWEGQTYHPGTSFGATSWGPIMGAPFGKNLTQWSNGDYANSTNSQNDLSIITKAANGFGYRPDDFGNTTFSAAPLASATPEIEWGIIERNTDVDMFRIETGGGNVRIEVEPMQDRPNLDVEASLVDERGTVWAVDNPLTSLGAVIDVDVPAGEYFLRIDGVGRDGRYSDYGSLGFYTIDATFNGVNDGDFNADGATDVTDIDLLTTDITAFRAGRGNPAIFDMTGDGLVDNQDLDAWLVTAGNANQGSAYLAGDSNLDGSVDVSDFNNWNSHKFTSDTFWSRGDFDASGGVDVSDFNIWNANRFAQSSRSTLAAEAATDGYDIDHAATDDGPVWPLGEPLDHDHDLDHDHEHDEHGYEHEDAFDHGSGDDHDNQFVGSHDADGRDERELAVAQTVVTPLPAGLRSAATSAVPGRAREFHFAKYQGTPTVISCDAASPAPVMTSPIAKNRTTPGSSGLKDFQETFLGTKNVPTQTCRARVGCIRPGLLSYATRGFRFTYPAVPVSPLDRWRIQPLLCGIHVTGRTRVSWKGWQCFVAISCLSEPGLTACG